MNTSIEFNHANWKTDPSLRSLSWGAKGVLVDLICLHTLGVDVASMSVQELSVEAACELVELQGYLDELRAAGLYPDVASVLARFSG